MVVVDWVGRVDSVWSIRNREGLDDSEDTGAVERKGWSEGDESLCSWKG